METKNRIRQSGVAEIPATDPCSSPADIGYDPMRDCDLWTRELWQRGEDSAKSSVIRTASVPNGPGAPRGTAGIMPRGRDGWHRTGPLAVVRCRAKSSAGWDGRALHARPFLV